MSMPEWLREPCVLRGDERRDDRRHLVSVEPDVERRIRREEVLLT